MCTSSRYDSSSSSNSSSSGCGSNGTATGATAADAQMQSLLLAEMGEHMSRGDLEKDRGGDGDSEGDAIPDTRYGDESMVNNMGNLGESSGQPG